MAAFTRRLMEMTECGETETARKACVELLKAGRADPPSDAEEQLKELRGKVPPWMLMSKLPAADRAESDRLYRRSLSPVEAPASPDGYGYTPDTGAEIHNHLSNKQL